MRDLVTNTIVCKFEGHSVQVNCVRFVQNAQNYSFVTSAANECLLWDFPASVLNGKNISEVSQPGKILDIESSDPIFDINGYQVMQGAFLINAVANTQQFIFMAKINTTKEASKSKVKKADSVLSLKEKNHVLMSSIISNDSSVDVVFGNQMQLFKQNVKFIEVETSTILKKIEIKGLFENNQLQTASKTQKDQNYQVVGMEDQNMAVSNPFSLFNPADIKNDQISSRKTSASTAI